MDEYVLNCKNVSKSFPGVRALDGVNFDLKRGEVHAICGENGAGKSTLIKILTGIYRKDSGEIEYLGKPTNMKNTLECRHAGISLIPQEISLAETLTVAENVFMAAHPKKHGFVDWKTMSIQTQKLMERLGGSALSFKPEQLVSTLSMGQMQLVEVLKAISTDVKVLAFDEPTSSLSDDETERLFKLIKDLTQMGISIIYVSHRIAEIFTICDRVTVFKDGKYIGTRNTKDINSAALISMMVGRDMNLFEKKQIKQFGEEILKVEHLCWGKKVRDVSFTVRKGEIVGMFGIVGAGRTETARLLFGLEKKHSGTIAINGKEVEIKHPRDAVKHKIGFVSEDRRGEGLAVVLDVAKNMTMPFLKRISKNSIVSMKQEAQISQEMVAKLSVKTPSIKQIVANLSGGNQQKIVIAKWLAAETELLILDEPTRGIDVGAKAEIYHLMEELTKQGKAILMISSELPETLAMSDRLLVMRDGEIICDLPNVSELTEDDVLSHAISMHVERCN